jgi:hypothetical protein
MLRSESHHLSLHSAALFVIAMPSMTAVMGYLSSNEPDVVPFVGQKMDQKGAR